MENLEINIILNSEGVKQPKYPIIRMIKIIVHHATAHFKAIKSQVFEEYLEETVFDILSRTKNYISTRPNCVK